MLRLRVYPDEFSIRRRVAPPTARGTRSARGIGGEDDGAAAAWTEADAFASFAAAVGAARALGLWRDVRRRRRRGRRSPSIAPARRAHEPFAVHGPAGLPETSGGVVRPHERHAPARDDARARPRRDRQRPRHQAAVRRCGRHLQPARCRTPGGCRTRARRMSALRADIDIGLTPPIARRARRPRHWRNRRRGARRRAQRRRTHGRARTRHADQHRRRRADDRLRRDARTRSFRCCIVDPATQMSTAVVLDAADRTGRRVTRCRCLAAISTTTRPGSLAVQGLWPVLWGRVLRDVIGAGANETALARWAIRNLAVEGPRPAFRVGEQPYGLLPTTAFDCLGRCRRATISPASKRASASGRSPGARAAATRPGSRAAASTARTPVDWSTRSACMRRRRYWNARAIADLLRPAGAARDVRHAAARHQLGRQHAHGPCAASRNRSRRSDARRAKCRFQARRMTRRKTSRLLRSLPHDGAGAAARYAAAEARPRRSPDARVAHRCARDDRRCGRSPAKPDSRSRSVSRSRGPTKRRTATRSSRARTRRSPSCAPAQTRTAVLIAERFKEVQEALQVIADLWEVDVHAALPRCARRARHRRVPRRSRG